MFLNCGVGEDSLRVPWTARRSNQSSLKEISPKYSLEGLMLKLQYSGTWWEELTHLKRPWCWERLKVGGEGDDWGWDGWMASPTRWTWVWVSSGSWWWTGRLGMLQSMGSQRVGHDWTTELNWFLGWSKPPPAHCCQRFWSRCSCFSFTTHWGMSSSPPLYRPPRAHSHKETARSMWSVAAP